MWKKCIQIYTYAKLVVQSFWRIRMEKIKCTQFLFSHVVGDVRRCVCGPVLVKGLTSGGQAGEEARSHTSVWQGAISWLLPQPRVWVCVCDVSQACLNSQQKWLQHVFLSCFWQTSEDVRGRASDSGGDKSSGGRCVICFYSDVCVCVCVCDWLTAGDSTTCSRHTHTRRNKGAIVLFSSDHTISPRDNIPVLYPPHSSVITDPGGTDICIMCARVSMCLSDSHLCMHGPFVCFGLLPRNLTLK